MVRNWSFHCWGSGSTPGQRINIPQPTECAPPPPLPTHTKAQMSGVERKITIQETEKWLEQIVWNQQDKVGPAGGSLTMESSPSFSLRWEAMEAIEAKG